MLVRGEGGGKGGSGGEKKEEKKKKKRRKRYCDASTEVSPPFSPRRVIVCYRFIVYIYIYIQGDPQKQ